MEVENDEITLGTTGESEKQAKTVELKEGETKTGTKVNIEPNNNGIVEEESIETVIEQNNSVEVALASKQKSETLESRNEETKTTDMEVEEPLKRKDIKQLFAHVMERCETEYKDEMQKKEAELYRQSKINNLDLMPDITNLPVEKNESDIETMYNEFAEDKSMVRTLDNFAFYDKYGNMIKLIDVLEKPYYDFTNDITCYGTVILPLPERLRIKPTKIPEESNRTIVRQLLERSIPRGFRQSDFCTASPKHVKSIKKATPKKARKSPLNNSNLNFNSPHYIPGVSREEAQEQAKKLISTVEMPLKVGTIRVINLGVISPEKGYHTSKHLYPVGFESVRQYTSVLDPNLRVSYTSEILEGDSGPIFKVTHEGNAAVYEASTSSAAWLKVLKALNERKRELGMPPKGTAISGPEMMGFAHKKIAAVIEGLDNVLLCEKYIFRAQRVESGAPKRKLAEITTPLDSPSNVSIKTDGESSIASPVTSTTPVTKTTKSQVSSETIFQENESFSRKKQKVMDIESELPKFTPENLLAVKKISKSLSIMATTEEKQILIALQALVPAKVNFELLYSVGLGKVVNRLRKHNAQGVSEAAKALKKKWVKESKEGAEVTITDEDKTFAKKLSNKLVSYIGFGDDEAPKGIKGHLSVNSSRIRLKNILSELDNEFNYIPVDVLVDTNIGKRVNKLRKHLDEDIQILALKLKSKWKKQIAEDEIRQDKLFAEASKRKAHAFKSSNGTVSSKDMSKYRPDTFTFDETIDIVKSKGTSLTSQLENLAMTVFNRCKNSRLRVKLSKICGIQITHNNKQADATLWLVTKDARYRIAGERCISMPSFRYYEYFRDAFHAFQSAVYTLRVLKQEKLTLSLGMLPQGMSQVAAKRAKLRLMLLAASTIIKSSTKCPCPRHKQLKIIKEERQRRLNFAALTSFYETVLDEITRFKDEKKVKSWLDHWFIEILINRGNCFVTKKKKDNLKLEKDYFKKRNGAGSLSFDIFSAGNNSSSKAKELAGKRMVREGINLPDDLLVQLDDKLPDSAKLFKFLPKENLFPAEEPWPLSNFTSLKYPSVSKLLARQENVFCSNFKSEELEQQLSEEIFMTLFSSWMILKNISEVLDTFNQNSSIFESFYEFRRKFENNDVYGLCPSLLRAIAENSSNVGSGEHSRTVVQDTTFKILTRSNTGADDGYVTPLNEASDSTSTYAYHSDILFPFPSFLITEASWPAILKRYMKSQLQQKVQNSSSSLFVVKKENLLNKPDLIIKCDEIISDLMDNPSAVAFSAPVDIEQYPHYVSLISRPMDLNTIRDRLYSGHYDEENKPQEADYESLLEVPKVVLEAEQEENAEENEGEESEGNTDGEDDDEEEEEVEEKEGGGENNTVDVNGRKLLYIIKRKSRKNGKLRAKTEYQLQVELHNKEKEVKLLTEDERFYLHDCKGAGHRGILADIRQVWRNCRKFNRKSTRIYSDSKKLESIFEKKYSKAIASSLADDFVDTDPAQVTEDKKKDGSERELLSKTMPTIEECFNILSAESHCNLHISHKVVIFDWLVSKVVELPSIKTHFVTKLDILNQLEKEEIITSKLEQRSANNVDQKNERRKKYLQLIYENTIRLSPVGLDRNFKRYFAIFPLVNESGWLLKEDPYSGRWSVYDKQSHITSLLSSLDRRGQRENNLYSKIKEFWSPLLKNGIENRTRGTSQLLKRYEDSKNITAESQNVLIRDCQEKLLNKNIALSAANEAAKIWKDAYTKENKIYYYHVETRETTWTEPASWSQQEKLQVEVDTLEEEIRNLSQTPEEKQEQICEQVKSCGQIFELGSQIGQSTSKKSQYSPQAVLYFLACLKALESYTLGPACVMSMSQNHSKWCEENRPSWINKVDQILISLGSCEEKIVQREVSNEFLKMEEKETKVEDILDELILEVETFHTKRRTNRYLRHACYKSSEILLEQVCIQRENWKSSIDQCKQCVLDLVTQFKGNPYALEHLQAQEACIRISRHECRLKRSLNNCQTLEDIGLMEIQLRHILGIIEDSRYTRLIEKEKKGLEEYYEALQESNI